MLLYYYKRLKKNVQWYDYHILYIGSYYLLLFKFKILPLDVVNKYICVLEGIEMGDFYHALNMVIKMISA